MSLINTTAEWDLDRKSFWSYKGEGANCMVSPILPSSHAVKFETTSNRSGGIFPVIVNFD